MKSLFSFILIISASSYAKHVESIPFDGHIHFHPGVETAQEKALNAYIERYKVQSGFVIASAYMAASPNMWSRTKSELDDNDFPTGEKRNIWKPEFRRKTFEETSKYIKNKDNFYGLCGVNLEWEDLVELTNYCLSLPKMIGLKVHPSGNTEEFDLERANRLDKLLQVHFSNARLTILWHPGTDSELYNSNDVINRVFGVIQSNPTHMFVIAHTFESQNVTKALKAKLVTGELDIPQNVYFDTAAHIPHGKEEMSEWRTVGFNRIMFGSDVGFLDLDEVTEDVEDIFESPHLSDIEKESIMYNVGPMFLQKAIK